MPFYKGPAGFERFMNIFMNLVIAIGIATLVLSFEQSHNPHAPIFTPVSWVISFLENFAFGMAVINILPVVKWANAAGARIKSKFGSLVVQSIIFDLIMSTVLSIIVCTISNIQTMGPAGTFMAWIGVYPWSLVLVFFISLIFMPLFKSLSAKLSGFDPRKMPAGGPAGPMGPGHPDVPSGPPRRG